MCRLDAKVDQKNKSPICMQANKSYLSLKMFNEMRTQKCKPNICTYTALINAFARAGQCEKAEEMFELLQEAGLEPDVYAYNALMEAYRSVSRIGVNRFHSTSKQMFKNHQNE